MLEKRHYLSVDSFEVSRPNDLVGYSFTMALSTDGIVISTFLGIKNYSNYVIVLASLVFLAKVLLAVLSSFRNQIWCKKHLKDFPSCPKIHWLFGNIPQLRDSEGCHQKYAEITEKYPLYIQIWIGPFNGMLACHHPETVKAILSAKAPKDFFVYTYIKPWLGNGLIISSGDKWRRNRHLLTPGFHFDVLKPYASIFCESFESMLNEWSQLSQKGSIELFRSTSRATLESLMKCIGIYENNHSMGRCGDKSNPYLSYIQAVNSLSELIVQRSRDISKQNELFFHLTPSGAKWRNCLKIVHQHSEKIIQRRRKELQGNSLKQNENKKYIDFLDILLAAKDEDGKGLTDAEIRDEVDTFIFAGHDTTACGIAWCLYNLAIHPEYQDKCRQEVKQLFEKKGNAQLQWNDLGELKYITKCIKESQRTHPVVPVISRQLSQPLTFPDGKSLPAGMSVGINVASLHKNSHVWKNPDTYDPERFSVENVKNRHPYAFIPFSAGTRNCIGQNFAMAEMKVAIAMTVKRFNLHWDDSVPITRVNTIVMRAKNGVYLQAKEIK